MKPRHIFHTRHDFSPLVAMEVAKILAACQDDHELNAKALAKLASFLAFPISGRRNLNKILASFCDIGLLERKEHPGAQEITFIMTEDFRHLMEGPGTWQSGFNAAVHARYFFNWAPDQKVATPCWSYRTACRVILQHYSQGVDVDDLVVAIVEEAGHVFGVSQVAFSPSSVKGIMHWLEAQAIPLAYRRGKQVLANPQADRSEDSVLALIHQIMKRDGSPLALTPPLINDLASALLVPDDLALEILRRVVSQDQSLLWFDDSTPVILNPHTFLP